MNSKIIPKKTYVLVWAALMFLLFTTWGLTRVDLGFANTPAALLVSGIKMLLVILIFMHVRYNSRSVWIFAAAGFFWFLIMVTLTMSDYLTREPVKPYDHDQPVASSSPAILKADGKSTVK